MIVRVEIGRYAIRRSVESWGKAIGGLEFEASVIYVDGGTDLKVRVGRLLPDSTLYEVAARQKRARRD